MGKKQILFFSTIMLMLFGCAVTSTNQSQMSREQIDNNRRQNYVISHPSLPEEIKQNILNGVIQIGMTNMKWGTVIGK